MSTIKTSGTAKADLLDRRQDTANNQVLSGGAGNDTLYGSAQSDTLDGGAGNDLMVGGAGNDLYFVNASGDSVVEDATGGIDTIDTTLSIDLSASASRFQNIENLVVNSAVSTATAITLGGNALANVLTGHAGKDTLKGYAGNDTLLGLAGNDVLEGGEGDDRLDGGAGSDKLNGGDGNDTLILSSGSDTLVGGLDSDTYVLNANFKGARTVINDAGLAGENNTLLIADGTQKSDLWFTKSGNDLRVNILSRDEIVTIKDWFNNQSGLKVVYANSDGSTPLTLDTKSLASLASFVGSPVFENARNLSEVPADLKELATAAFNGMWTNSIAPPPPPPAPVVTTQTGTIGNDVMAGGAGNDSLVALEGDDRLTLSAGLDTLVGGLGSDTYVFNSKQVGARTTISDAGLADEHNTLVITDGSTRNDLWFTQSGNDLVIDELATDSVITVKDWFNNTSSLTVLHGNADGTGLVALRSSDVASVARLNATFGPARNLSQVSADDLAFATDVQRALWAMAKPVLPPQPEPVYNSIVGTDEQDTLTGGSGNDRILGQAGNDTITLSGGKDLLIGGDGSDAYMDRQLTPGARTTIDDRSLAGEPNALWLADGAKAADLWFTRVQGTYDLRIDNPQTDEVITVQNWFANQTGLSVVFANADLSNAVVLSSKQLASAASFSSGYEGARSLADVPESDRELVQIAYQSLWSQASPITPAPTPTPTPEPTPGQSLVAEPTGGDLFGGAGNDTLTGLAGDDWLIGELGDDTLIGGGGFNILLGGKGNDTYVVSRGAAFNGVNDTNEAGNHDVVRVADVSFDHLWFSTSGPQRQTLSISEIGGGVVAQISGWNVAGTAIEEIQAPSPNGLVSLDLAHLQSLVNAMAGFGVPGNLQAVAPSVTTAQQLNWSLPATAVATPV
ncbi:MAG: hypothetical protein RI907_3016 [Pseudomonadota bacterium]|jgi:Ca2+-binding RTX toxin-like protein